jgi:hypothetical protein
MLVGMARVLFTSCPAYGHVLPLLPLVRAGERDGHDVRVATGVPDEQKMLDGAVALFGSPALARLDDLLAMADDCDPTWSCTRSSSRRAPCWLRGSRSPEWSTPSDRCSRPTPR